jgi:DNA-binding FrmR family transcriptional regulator
MPAHQSNQSQQTQQTKQTKHSLKTDTTLNQLKRVRGQLDGIIRMYEDERACVDIVRQIIAARNSLSTVAKAVLVGEANRCTKKQDVGSLEKVVAELFKY